MVPLSCYPLPAPPVAPVVAPTSPPKVSEAAAVAIQKEVKDTEVRVKDVGLALYEKVVEATRRRKVTQAQFSAFQTAYDMLTNQVHSYAVLSPLGGLPADNAKVGVAKALYELLLQAQQLLKKDF